MNGGSGMTNRVVVIAVSALTVVGLSGCFPGGSSYTPAEPAGFFSGVWHGWIAPISLIIGIFKDGVRIYEPQNTGWWYDCGFYIAVIAGFGGIDFFRRTKKHRSSRH
jgi:hypothetical protein